MNKGRYWTHFFILVAFWTIVAFVIVRCCYAQSVVDFSGGLYTNINPHLIPLQTGQKAYATECLNIDLRQRTLKKRKGYAALTGDLRGSRPLYGLYGNTLRTGKKNVYAVFSQPEDSATIGLGKIYRSDNYTYLPDTTYNLYDWIYTGATPFWTTWKDDIFFSNGRQKPIIIRDSTARNLTPQAPGEPNIYVMNDSGAWGGPEGSFRYVVNTHGMDSSAIHNNRYHSGYMSDYVTALKEKIMLTNFIAHAPDTIWIKDDTTIAGWDSIDLEIYRSMPDIGKVNDSDTAAKFYLVCDTVILKSLLDTFKVIDSFPNDSLVSARWEYGAVLFNELGRDSVSAGSPISGYYNGSPTYISGNQGISIFPDSLADSTNTVSVKYIVTYIDTLTGFESDSGRSLRIEWVYGDSNYTIGLPPVPKGMGHLSRAIYKSYRIATYNDTGLAPNDSTTYVVEKGLTVIYDPGPEMDEIIKNQFRAFLDTLKNHALGTDENIDFDKQWQDINIYKMLPFRVAYSHDTLETFFRQIAVIEDTLQVYFKDTVSFDSTMKGKLFYRGNVPGNLNGIASFNDQLFGYKGSGVYWSNLDTAGVWGMFRHIALNKDDGDEITAIMPFRDYVKVYKNRSQYIIYPINGGFGYAREWTVQGVGCVAPHSMVQYNNGLVYLSNIGVIHETGIQYKDKGSNYPVISEPIADLMEDYSPSELRGAVGFVNDDKYYLSFPSKDTSYIYDFIVGAWSIYSYAFTQATFYDTVHRANISPSKDMLFILDDADKIYKADTTYTDAGEDFAFSWKSPPFGKVPGHNIGLQQIGFGCVDKDLDSLCLYYVYDYKDTGTVFEGNYSPDATYEIRGMPTHSSPWFYLGLHNYCVDETHKVSQLEINLLDIWTNDKGIITIK